MPQSQIAQPDRDWRKFGFGIVERVNAAPSIVKLEQLLTLHTDNLVGYGRWNQVKYDQLMELVAEVRAELKKNGDKA